MTELLTETIYRETEPIALRTHALEQRVMEMQRQINRLSLLTGAPRPGGIRRADVPWCQSCGDRFALGCEDHVHDALTEVWQAEGEHRDAGRTEIADALAAAGRAITKHTGVCLF